MEEGKTEDKGVYESDELNQKDCERVCDVLEKIVNEGRIIKTMAIRIVLTEIAFLKNPTDNQNQIYFSIR